MKGKFITFEGPEGSGKTSVIKAVVEKLKNENIDVITTREPGGIRIAEKIRDIILDVENVEMDLVTEALLFAASRRQHMVEIIWPALNENKLVICDRYVDSSLAYQGVGRGLGIDRVYAINQYAIEDCLPNLTIFIDVPPNIGIKRVLTNNRDVDRLDLENIAFHEKVYLGYREVIARYPDRIKVVDGTQPIEKVIADAMVWIKTLL